MIERFAALLPFFSLLMFSVNAYPEDAEDARAKFLEGVALYKEESYPGALAAFEASYRIVPKAKLLYNIGMCQKAVHNYTKALATFRKYLDEGGKEGPERKRKNAESAISEMEKLVGALSITDAPEDASIILDGESIGASPLGASLVLDPGQHKVRVTKAGFEPFETTVNIVSGEALTTRVDLKPAKGILSVTCSLETAVVKMDGLSVGGCPYEGNTEPGEHQISVTAPGMQPFNRQVIVAADERITLAVSLIPEPVMPEPETRPRATERVPEAPPAPIKRKRPVSVAVGAAALTFGAGFCVIGAYYNYRASRDETNGNNANRDMKDERDPEEYEAQRDTFVQAKEDLKIHSSLMFIGYSVGGALVVTGVTLLVVGMKEKKLSETAAVSVTGRGLSVRF